MQKAPSLYLNWGSVSGTDPPASHPLPLWVGVTARRGQEA